LLKGCLIASKPVLPGIWLRKDGGYLVRARAKDGTTGKLKEIFKVMPEADPATALKWLHDERARVREGVDSAPTPKQRFSEFAAQQFEHKVKVRDIKSAKGRKKWGGALEHLVKGTTGKTSGVFVRGFGDFYMHKIHSSHVETWKEEMAVLIAAGDYAPTTVNGWLAILKVIMKAGKRRLSLPFLATEGVESFDLSEHETYTDEEPNSLTPDEVPSFLAKFKELHPAHYGMVFLGLVTGLRPSSLRPLRREGPESDVDWDKGLLRVRRSHTVGEEVMRTTKQKRRYMITLPPEAMAVLRWHVDTQLATPEQQDSELLFPAVNGKFRSVSVLNKPLDDVGTELGLKKKITQRALRRTFNDLARAAQVNDLVTRSISGHQTEQMQQHYSTVNGVEQRDALAKVISLFGASGGQSGGQNPSAGGQKSEKAG
jgi:integrase